jgi:YidC/Oxa1 family membrane protein insertase
MWDTLVINPMVNILLWIYSIIGNFGIAIILFTILIRLVTHPLTVKQIKMTAGMQEIQKSPEWLEIQAKYKDDKQKLQQEQMRLYQAKKINPLGSCLPTLIQFPIIFGLYGAIVRVLTTSPIPLVSLSKHVYPFIDVSKLVPVNNHFLWMDLSQPERFYIPGLSFGIPVLAILVVITSYMSSKLMTPPTQPGDQGAQMGQMMNLYMPFLMGYFALTFNAGLSVYFITSNVFSIAQYAVLGKVTWSNLLPKNMIPKLNLFKPAPSLEAGNSPKKPAGNTPSKSNRSSTTKSSSSTKKSKSGSKN